jgi:hypothetical protein
MLMNVSFHYLDNMKKLYRYYKLLAEKAMQQLEPQQLLYSHNVDSNSIATIVKHMHGNMLSRWTDFLTTDGEKPNRNRDGEFENDLSAEKVFELWEEGWACVFSALDNIEEDQLLFTVYIRKEAHTVMEAINRQLAHYSYHAGQIVYAAKMLKQGEWQSLSIPRKK